VEERDLLDSIPFGNDFLDQLPVFDKVIRVLWSAWLYNRPVFILGNGGSASTATHFAGDLCKTINNKPGHRGIRAMSPWDNIPHISAIVNDRPKEDYFNAWLDNFYEDGGVGVAFSVHGGSGADLGGKWSQNILRALQRIKDSGGPTIGFSGYEGGPMKDLVDHCLVVPVEKKALGTPLVEGFHPVAFHLIVFRLKELIEEYESKKSG
jgi:D-sedoheptulose 7-phosphate isomerase